MVRWAPVLNPNGLLIGWAVFAEITSVTERPTDRLTDHATRSVTIGSIHVGRPYVVYTAKRPKS